VMGRGAKTQVSDLRLIFVISAFSFRINGI